MAGLAEAKSGPSFHGGFVAQPCTNIARDSTEMKREMRRIADSPGKEFTSFAGIGDRNALRDTGDVMIRPGALYRACWSA